MEAAGVIDLHFCEHRDFRAVVLLSKAEGSKDRVEVADRIFLSHFAELVSQISKCVCVRTVCVCVCVWVGGWVRGLVLKICILHFTI